MQTHNSFLNRVRIISALATTLAAMATLDADCKPEAVGLGGLTIERQSTSSFTLGAIVRL